MHRNPELEAAICEEPTSTAAWQVYSDWLQERDDPRGELIALELEREDLDARAGAGHDERIAALYAEHRATWLGDAAALVGDDDEHELFELSWDKGYVVEARFNGSDEEDAEGPDPTALIQAFVASPAATFVRKLVIGASYEDDEWMGLMYPNVDAMLSAGELPALTELEIRDPLDFWDISSTVVGDLDAALAAAPRLRRLYVRGNEIGADRLEHARLEQLTIETGGLDDSTARSIASCRLPACRELTLFFGSSNYGGSTTLADLAPLLTGEGVAKLESLGLCNAEFQDELPAALAASPVLGRLRALNLSLGTMTATGAQVLIDQAERFGGLARLDLRNNFIPAEQCEALRRALPGVELELDQRTPYVHDGSPHYYVSLGE